MVTQLLIKPAGPDCSLACAYCFYREKQTLYPDTTRMSDETLGVMIRQAMGLGHEVSFVWQGGEPTLMGLDFYRRVIELQALYGESGQVVSNCLQTNGVSVDARWASFLTRFNFLVGISLDGPKELHDRYRRTPTGSGSWRSVVRAARRLRRAGVATTALTVLTDVTVRQPEAVLDCLLGEGLSYLQFVPAVERAADGESQSFEPFSPSPAALGRFLDTLFRRWSWTARPQFNVRYFDSLLRLLVGLPPASCETAATCGSYLVVEHNGDVYPCDFFVEDRYRLGNLHECSLGEICDLPAFRSFAERKREIPDACTTCEYVHLCHGGCPRYRGLLPGAEGRSYFCETTKYFLDRNLKELQETASRIDVSAGLGCA